MKVDENEGNGEHKNTNKKPNKNKNYVKLNKILKHLPSKIQQAGNFLV